MELYHKYQPVTCYIGVIEATPSEVANAIQPLYAPPERLKDICHVTMPIEEALSQMEPLGLADKFLLVETKDGKTVMFGNAFYSMVQLPTWTAGENLGVSAYYICNVPNTISKDQRKGKYGALILEYRKPENPYGHEPTFGVEVINDCGKWHFYRFGEVQPFENEKAYRSFRKTDRFTVEMLVKYCRELGIPVYDRDWYSDNTITIHRLPPTNLKFTYKEARIELRIKKQ